MCPYLFGKYWCFRLDSEWMFAKLVLLNEKLGVMRVVTSQWGLTRPSSIFSNLVTVRDIVTPIMIVLCICVTGVTWRLTQCLHHGLIVKVLTFVVKNIQHCSSQFPSFIATILFYKIMKKVYKLSAVLTSVGVASKLQDGMVITVRNSAWICKN